MALQEVLFASLWPMRINNELTAVLVLFIGTRTCEEAIVTSSGIYASRFSRFKFICTS